MTGEEIDDFKAQRRAIGVSDLCYFYVINMINWMISF